jgi:glycosyltransferase involved in cell wall biosynthesis
VFSVLISVYHKENAASLNDCLESVFKQSLLPTEVVLVKDGPLGDDLEEVIKKFVDKSEPKIKVVPLPENVGMSRALNEGIKNCSYDWIARMDSDDICVFNRFELQFDYLNQNPQVTVCGSCIEEYDEEMKASLAIRKVPEKHEDILKFAQFRSPLNHMTVIYKKEEVLQAGLYPFLDRKTNIEDYVLWCRLLQNGSIFHNIQQNLVLARTGKNMLSKRSGWSYFSIEYRYLKLLSDSGFFTGVNFYANLFIRFFARILPQGMLGFIYRLIRL